MTSTRGCHSAQDVSSDEVLSHRQAMKARVIVTLKPEIHDPQGVAVHGALLTLGFSSVLSVRVGKFLELDIEAPDKAVAEQHVRAMCEKLLANQVIEHYHIEIP